jgi:hypothetical protein
MHTALVNYSKVSQFASKKIISQNNTQSLIGLHKFYIIGVAITYLKEVLNTNVVLCSNIISNYELSSSGIAERVYTPVCLFHLNAAKDTNEVLKVPHKLPFIAEGVTEIMFWLEDLSKKKIDIQLDVNIAYCKNDER